MPGRRGPVLLWLVVLLGPAVLKLFLLRADQVFETHTMALEWIASGEFRHYYLGSWDHAFQMPVHTAILAIFRLAGLGLTAMLVFQVLCGTLTALLIQRTAANILRGSRHADRVAWATALLTGLSPFLAYYQVRMVHPFAWDMLLATALLHASFTADPARRVSLVALFALAGLAVLDRPTLGVFLLPFVLRHGRSLLRWDRLALNALLLLLLFGPVGSWVLRNHAATGRYQLTSVTDQMIWMGLQEETEGSGHLADGTDYRILLSPPECERILRMDAAERSAFFKAKWEAEVREEPGLWWRMLGIKLRNFWLFRSHPGLGHGAEMGWAMAVYKVYAVLLFVLLLVQVAVFRHRSLMAIFLAVAALSLLQCAFYFETRHRLLAEPMLLLVGIATIAMGVERLRRGTVAGG